MFHKQNKLDEYIDQNAFFQFSWRFWEWNQSLVDPLYLRQ